MAGSLMGVAIRPQIRRQTGQRATAHGDEQRITESAEYGKRVLAGTGNTDRRMRRLERPRHRARLIELPVFASVRETRLRPGLFKDVQRLVEPLAALRIRHAV